MTTDFLPIVLRLTVTETGTLPLLSTTPIMLSLPLESTKDCCFFILMELSTIAACAVPNEGNSNRTENVKTITSNTTAATSSVDTKSRIIITLYHILDYYYDYYLATSP